jgi:hypothetical protein
VNVTVIVQLPPAAKLPDGQLLVSVKLPVSDPSSKTRLI